MLIPNKTTAVPNVVFDFWMKQLKPSALCILLVIIRQTLGRSKNDNNQKDRREKDWISSSQLRDKSGYSGRAISTATEALVRNNLISVFDEMGRILDSPERRKGKQRMFYSLTNGILCSEIPVDKEGKNCRKKHKTEKTGENFAESIRKMCATLAKKLRITK